MTTHIAQQQLLRPSCRQCVGAVSHHGLLAKKPVFRSSVVEHKCCARAPRTYAALKQASTVGAGADYFASDNRPVILFDGVCNL